MILAEVTVRSIFEGVINAFIVLIVVGIGRLISIANKTYHSVKDTPQRIAALETRTDGLAERTHDLDGKSENSD